MATAKTALAKLREPFPVEAVKQRAGSGGKKLDYVAIETVLTRLLDVDPEFTWDTRDVTVTTEVNETEDGTKRTYVAVVTGELSAAGKFACGVGAMKNPDPDMAVKSANSEAMKNAAKNGFGVALELWDEEYREGLARRRKMVNATEATLKNEVFRIAKERLGKARPTAKEIATLFGVPASALADEEGLRGILEAEGVL